MAQGLKPSDNPVKVRELETQLLLVVFPVLIFLTREDSMITGTHLQYRTQDQATHTRYVPTTKGNIPTKKKNTRHMYTAVYTLAADGAVFDTPKKN